MIDDLRYGQASDRQWRRPERRRICLRQDPLQGAGRRRQQADHDAGHRGQRGRQSSTRRASTSASRSRSRRSARNFAIPTRPRSSATTRSSRLPLPREAPTRLGIGRSFFPWCALPRRWIAETGSGDAGSSPSLGTAQKTVDAHWVGEAGRRRHRPSPAFFRFCWICFLADGCCRSACLLPWSSALRTVGSGCCGLGVGFSSPCKAGHESAGSEYPRQETGDGDIDIQIRPVKTVARAQYVNALHLVSRCVGQSS